MKRNLHTDREWIETNGIGAFASSTEDDCHVRKYHGLFLTPLNGQEGRFMLLSDALLTLETKSLFTLGSSYYPGVIHPDGHLYLESFSTSPVPTWIYNKGELRIKKEILMIDGDASIYVIWTLLESEGHSSSVNGSIKLLCNFRNSHHLSSENDMLNKEIFPINQGFSINPYWGLPSLAFQFSQDFHHFGDFYWDNRVEYPRELRRGFDYEEDRFVPGEIRVQLDVNIPFVFRASLNPLNKNIQSNLLQSYTHELEKRKNMGKTIKSPWERLEYNSRHFMVTNSAGQLSIVAGYPWFGEWGRDTMIALPGLTFARHPEEGARVLCDYAAHIEKGLLPNTLGEMQGFTSYNSLDASLLYLRAVELLIEEGYGIKECEEKVLKTKLFPAVKKIITAFLSDEVPNAELTETGLINAGSEKTQLTWMDAMVKGDPVTPRHGLAVDLNALWYGGLILYKNLCYRFHKAFPRRASKILKGFTEAYRDTFYLEEEGFLTDTVYQGKADRKVRPNMLFATAVKLLNHGEGKNVVEKAREELLTPLGMRTLSPHDPQFAPVFEGTGEERDRVYHQGTVWPWPLGLMVESALNYTDDIEKEKLFWKEYLNNLLDIHLDHQGIDFLSEVFDGGEPLEGKGCFAQAWSVGEVLRAWRMINE